MKPSSGDWTACADAAERQALETQNLLDLSRKGIKFPGRLHQTLSQAAAASAQLVESRPARTELATSVAREGFDP